MVGSSTKKNLNTGDLVDTLAVTGRFDLTAAQWAALEPLLPRPSRSGRPSLWGKRQLIDGIGGGSVSVRRGGTFPRRVVPGRRLMGCSGAGDGSVSGRWS
ncbi:hypothetical protein Acsp05_17900 [Actinokineospora sp. NBRC 105648]|nr:hypothetical protein Acsp05_17900 [Actinokineospora sp. NBRC 105648]